MVAALSASKGEAPSSPEQESPVKLDQDVSGNQNLETGSEPSSTQLDPALAKKAANSDRWTVIAAGAALVSDGYFNNTMTMTNVLFQKRYGKSIYTSEISTRISNALLVGAIIGQITVGIICDRLGRKAGVTVTTTLLVVGAIFATAASPINGNVSNLFWWLTVARGAIGVGVGGEYPASSTSASEAANERYSKRSRSSVFILVTNALLSIGGPFAVSVFLIVLSATGYDNSTSPSAMRNLDITWRVCFGFGVLLPLVIFYFRLKILNSKLYRQNAIKKQVPYWLAIKRYWPRLLGTAGVWFVYDFVVFPNGVFSATIIATVVKDATLLRTGEWQLLLGIISLPGVFIGAWLVRHIGSRWLLIFGFSGYIVLGLIIGLAYDKLVKIAPLFIVLYGILTSFGNAGPGNVCGLVSSEIYPSALRGTFYGISAAIGKTGAAVGVQAFQPIQIHLGKKYTFIIAACCGVVGVALAFFLIPDTTKYDLGEEDLAWRRYLEENGWKGQWGDGSQSTVVEDERNALPYGGKEEDMISPEEEDVSKRTKSVMP